VDPYQSGIAARVSYTGKRTISAKIVAVLQGALEDRGLKIIFPRSRAVRQHDVIELMITTQKECKAGDRVDRVTYIGFAEIQAGGVLRVGDRVMHKGEMRWTVVGFDETHYPNHLNVIMKTIHEHAESLAEVQLEDSIEFLFTP
jgi:hypothetical protein